jgi:cytochrome c oxidase subunit I+III
MSVAAPAVGNEAGGGHHVDRATKLRQFRMMVQLLIVSDAVFVACLFFAYLYLRALNVNHMWLPPSVHPPAAAEGWIITGLMAASAIVYRWGELGARAGRHGRLGAGVTVALVLIAAELVVQIHQLAAASFGPGAGAFASSFYAMAGYHAVHLAMLLLLGAGIAIRAGRGVYRDGGYNEATLVGYVWYWVTAMAIGMVLLPH